MTSWNLIPSEAIEFSGTRISFGDRPENVKTLIGSSGRIDNQNETFQWFGSHIMLKDVLGTQCSLMLEYQDDMLCSIRFYDGSLIFENIELCRTTIPELTESFRLKQFSLYYPSSVDVGQFCPELCIGVLCDGDSGGETDDVECVIVYRNKPIL